MQPIELILSVDRLTQVEPLQQNRLHDPTVATGDLTVKQLQEESKLKEIIVNEQDPLKQIDPDARRRHSDSRRKKKERPPTPPSEQDKGNKLDVLV